MCVFTFLFRGTEHKTGQRQGLWSIVTAVALATALLAGVGAWSGQARSPAATTAAASPPQNPTASPSAWSNVDDYRLARGIPAKNVAIAAAWHRIGNPASHPEGGSFVSFNQEPVPAAEDIEAQFFPAEVDSEQMVVPEEGEHVAYVWLEGGGGNADPRRSGASPPTTRLLLEGPEGAEGWFVGPVTATLVVSGAGSDPEAVLYRINGGPWIENDTFSLEEPGKYTVDFYARHVAGNVEDVKTETVRIDPDPPGAPLNLTAAPRGWQAVNRFRLSWTNPLDQSGIAGIWVKFGSPPTAPDDGIFYRAHAGASEDVAVPAEGRWDMWAWLQDNAGNVDHTTAVHMGDVFGYDATPPVTTLLVEGVQGPAAWFIEPVTVTFSVTDAVSGPDRTWYQINGGDWQVGSQVALIEADNHLLRVFSRDMAGNQEAIQEQRIKIDLDPPVASFDRLDHYQSHSQFIVRWIGHDPEPGSGVVSYDVYQWQRGQPWQPWLLDYQGASATFYGQRGQSYSFRVRARDASGQYSDWIPSIHGQRVYVEPFANNRFSAGTFQGWQTEGVLERAVIPVTGPSGRVTLAARLGTPDYENTVDPPNIGCIEAPGCVPVGAARISQTITLPPLWQLSQPTLVLWYRVLSYDVMWSELHQRYFDTFDVVVRDASGKELALLLRDGNPHQLDFTRPIPLWDSGWRLAQLDLSRWAGQTIAIEFGNHNREDNRFNTWSYVKSVIVRSEGLDNPQWFPVVGGREASPKAAAADFDFLEVAPEFDPAPWVDPPPDEPR